MALDRLQDRGFQVQFLSHAQAILESDFPDVLVDVEECLLGLKIPISEIVGSGGGETKGTQRLRRALAGRLWANYTFEIKKVINGVERESQSHIVDHVRIVPERGVIALEIEWNNKDPFFDRDLENFKRLHAEGAISAGIIVTRGESLQEALRPSVERFAEDRQIAGVDDLVRLGLNPTTRQRNDYERRMRAGVSFAEAWSHSFVQDKFGAATTHWRKLQDRVHRGVGNPCPLLLLGLPSSIIDFEDVAGQDDEED